MWVFKARLPTFAQQLNRITTDEPITVSPHNTKPFVSGCLNCQVMTAKKKLVKELIRSLNENWSDWSFNEHTAKNKKTGVEIWIANVPILNLGVYQPTPISFGLFDKIRIYKALNECRSLWVLSLNSH